MTPAVTAFDSASWSVVVAECAIDSADGLEADTERGPGEMRGTSC
jgi:hypothetical protein